MFELFYFRGELHLESIDLGRTARWYFSGISITITCWCRARFVINVDLCDCGVFHFNSRSNDWPSSKKCDNQSAKGALKVSICLN